MNKNVLDEKRWKWMDGAQREENECRNKTREFLEKFLRERAANVCVYIEKEVLMQIAVSVIFGRK